MFSVSPYSRSQSLYRAAQRLIPGGAHVSNVPLLGPDPSPMYFERGHGCRCWDVDGNEYIDFVMAYGGFLLGYAREEVDRAAMEQARRGNLLSLNHPLHLRFVEAVLQRFPAAEMAVFLKTGSEATTAAVRIARRHTGRRKVIRCGYHGWHDWCLPDEDFVPGGLARQVLPLAPVTAERLEVLLEQHAGEVAAVILAPETVLPLERSVVVALMELARRHGALFILDEVKTGFRTRPCSVQHLLGIAPDMTTLSKALGNGWPVSALIGKREVMQTAAGIRLSATYHGETAAMAAALVTLELLDRENVPAHVWRMGERLIDGLNALVARHRLPARAYGEPLPPMPFLAFTHPEETVNEALRATFYGEMFARGILLHPRHLWYVTGAHRPEDIDRTLEAADEAMRVTVTRHEGLLAAVSP